MGNGPEIGEADNCMGTRPRPGGMPSAGIEVALAIGHQTEQRPMVGFRMWRWFRQVRSSRPALLATGSWPVRRTWLRESLAGTKARLVAMPLLLALTLATLAGALWVFGELADEVAEEETRAVDDAVLAWLHHFDVPWLDAAARLASAMGSEVVAGLLVALLVIHAWQRRWGVVAAMLAVTGGSQLLNNVLKDHFQRTRPAEVVALIPAQAWSFPSGHAMVSASFYFFVAYLAWRLARGWLRGALVGVVLLVVALIGLSRLYLGVHYLSDVVAGYAAGAAWTAAVIAAGETAHLWRRRHIGPPAADPSPHVAPQRGRPRETTQGARQT